jgi:hypothetical protein
LRVIAATNDGWIRGLIKRTRLCFGFNYTQGGTLFASEPVIEDIDGDGAPKLSSVHTFRYKLEELGWPVGLWALKPMAWPPAFLAIPSPEFRPPTLADLDGDGGLDILAATLTGKLLSGIPDDL